MIITVEMIMGWKPCQEYTDERVREIIGNGKTLSEIFELDIPVEDRIWILEHKEILSEKNLQEWIYS